MGAVTADAPLDLGACERRIRACWPTDGGGGHYPAACLDVASCVAPALVAEVRRLRAEAQAREAAAYARGVEAAAVACDGVRSRLYAEAVDARRVGGDCGVVGGNRRADTTAR